MCFAKFGVNINGTQSPTEEKKKSCADRAKRPIQKHAYSDFKTYCSTISQPATFWIKDGRQFKLINTVYGLGS